MPEEHTNMVVVKDLVASDAAAEITSVSDARILSHHAAYQTMVDTHFCSYIKHFSMSLQFITQTNATEIVISFLWFFEIIFMTPEKERGRNRDGWGDSKTP